MFFCYPIQSYFILFHPIEGASPNPIIPKLCSLRRDHLRSPQDLKTFICHHPKRFERLQQLRGDRSGTIAIEDC